MKNKKTPASPAKTAKPSVGRSPQVQVATVSNAPQAGGDPAQDETDIVNTWEGIILIDYTGGNPNGDLNSGGNPLIDPINAHARANGESLRRKMRNYVMSVFEGRAPNDILIRGAGHLEREDGGTLTFDDQIQSCRKGVGLGFSPAYEKELATAKETAAVRKAKALLSVGTQEKAPPALTPDQARRVVREVKRRFWDGRTFGIFAGVGTDKLESCKGPLVIHDGESVHPVMDIHQANTRRMMTREKEKEKRNAGIGNRVVLRYALMQHVFTLSPASARVTGMRMVDFALALEAMLNCWTQDAAPHRRGVMRGMYLFKQPLRGRRPVPYDWTDVVEVKCKLADPIEASSFQDFDICVRADLIPKGVEILDLSDIYALIDEHQGKLRVA